MIFFLPKNHRSFVVDWEETTHLRYRNKIVFLLKKNLRRRDDDYIYRENNDDLFWIQIKQENFAIKNKTDFQNRWKKDVCILLASQKLIWKNYLRKH